MRKKDYELIAQALIRAQGHIALAHDEQTKPEVLYQWICKEVGDTLHDSNYRFDRQKFLTACGIEVQDCVHSNLNQYNSSWAECKNCGMQINIDTQEVYNSFEKPMFRR